MTTFHATTIFAVQHNGRCAMAGDGQVTMGNAVVMKHTAKKVRKLFNGKVLAGFAGSVADAFTLFEKFESKLQEYNGNLQRAAVELAKEWRSDKVLRKVRSHANCYGRRPIYCLFPVQVKSLNRMTAY